MSYNNIVDTYSAAGSGDPNVTLCNDIYIVHYTHIESFVCECVCVCVCVFLLFPRIRRSPDVWAITTKSLLSLPRLETHRQTDRYTHTDTHTHTQINMVVLMKNTHSLSF